MPIHAYDRPTWADAIAGAADPGLRAALAARRARLDGQGLLDLTDLLVLDAGTTDADLIEAIGWTPLIDPDGRPFGDPAFVSPIDYAFQQNGHLFGIALAGNGGGAVEFVTAAVRGHSALAGLLRELGA